MTDQEDFDREAYDDEPSRSLLSRLWFRALIVAVVLGGVTVVAAPSLLEMVYPRAPKLEPTPTASVPPPPVVAAPPADPPAGQPAPGSAASEAPARPDAAAAAPDGTGAAAGGPAPASASAAAPGPAVMPAPQTSPSPRASRVPARAKEPPRTAAATMLRESAPPRRAAPSVAAEAASATGAFWVQVGAFKDPAMARRVAAKLRDQRYRVEESLVGGASRPAAPPTAPEPAASVAPDRYQVFVSGVTAEEIAPRLSGRSLAAESVAGGVAVTPALPLGEAVALSRELTGDGRRVQVRRAAAAPGATAVAATPPRAASDGAERLHRVRVGGYASRAAADAVARELRAKGYQIFIARSGQQ